MSINLASASRAMTRRDLLSNAGCGFGSLALAGLMADQQLLANTVSSKSESDSPLSPRQPHFSARAKRVIFLFMYGGPSHVDLFDHKPALKKYEGKNVSEVVDKKGARSVGGLFPSPYKFVA